MDDTTTATNGAPLPPVAMVPAQLPHTEGTFPNFLGDKLQKYSLRTKNTVQFQINKILFFADLGYYEEEDSKQKKNSSH